MSADTSSASGQDWYTTCRNDPDLPACANIPSFYGYRLSLPANATFLALFSALLVAYLTIYVVVRRGFVFTFALTLGLVCEVLGYAGRVMSYKNQWEETGFFMQICCLTIGPAFMAAGVYLCLRRIVQVFGPENSRIKPEYYTRIFIPCDVISLVLQAAGGALASVSFHGDKSTDAGDNIMIAGLASQVATMLAFMILAADFGIRTMRRYRRLGTTAAFGSGYEDDATAAAAARVRGSLLFRGCLGALALATVCVFWRSVFRVAELSRGWSGPVMKMQNLFIGFEGVLVVVACLALAVFHPSICFRDLMASPGKATAGGAEKAGGIEDARSR